MYYIVSRTGARITIALVKKDKYGYEARTVQIAKRDAGWSNLIRKETAHRPMRSRRSSAEKYLYEDAKMYLCRNPKEYGGEK